jgi:hypothetical protein
MGSFDVRFTIQAHGPLMDGSAEPIIKTWLDGVKKDIAQEGLNELRAFVMDKTGRATGHYQSGITTTLLSYNDLKISNPTEAGFAYGPWLEGFSKRNRSTRFKGYHLWRLTAQRLQERAPKIAEAKLPELIQRLGGG